MAKEAPADLDAQTEMLQELRDMKRKVEAGEISSIALLANRTDGGSHVWVTAMPSADLAVLNCLLQAKTQEHFLNLQER